MRVHLPNAARLQNISHFFSNLDGSDFSQFQFSMHEKWVAVHPLVLAMTACAAARVRVEGGTITANVRQISSLPYRIRMKLFDHLGVDPGRKINEHEQSGRFIPLTQIKTTDDLKATIANLVPLLHAPSEVADPIRYVFSEMVRNSLEHSQSQVGAFVCAQYFKESGTISIGIADSGIGVYGSMVRNHPVTNYESAIRLALQPGITGTTSRFGGNEYNAGAGLFFTKSIATLSRNYFVLYSGNSAFRLMKTPAKNQATLQADPNLDHHQMVSTFPHWAGTAVGLDLSITQGTDFAELLNRIKAAYFLDVRQRRDYSRKLRFKP